MQHPYDIQIMYRCLREYPDVCSLVAYFDLAVDTVQPNTPSYIMAVQYSNMKLTKTFILGYMDSVDSDGYSMRSCVQSHELYGHYVDSCKMLSHEYAGVQTNTESVPVFLLCRYFESVREYVVAAWHHHMQQFTKLHAFKLERVCMRAADCILAPEKRPHHCDILQDPEWCRQVVREFDAMARLNFCGSMILSAGSLGLLHDFVSNWFRAVYGSSNEVGETILGKTRDEMARFVICWYQGISQTEPISQASPNQYRNFVQQLESCNSTWVAVKIISVLAQHNPRSERIRFCSLVEDTGGEQYNPLCPPLSMPEVRRITVAYLREMQSAKNGMALYNRIWFGCSLMQYTRFCDEEIATGVQENALIEVYLMISCMQTEMKIFLCNLCRQNASNRDKIMKSIKQQYGKSAFPDDRFHKWIRSTRIESKYAEITVLLVQIAGPEFFDMIMRCSMFFQNRVFRYCPLEMRQCVNNTMSKAATFQQMRNALYKDIADMPVGNLWNAAYTTPESISCDTVEK